WVASGMERVGRNDSPSSMIRAELNAARGEYEPFQVVIQGPKTGSLTNVNFAVSDLHSPQGGIIAKTNMTLYREHYVYVSHSSPDHGGTNVPLGQGWYPDALVPFIDPATQQPPTGGTLKAVPFDLSPQTNQPIWIDVFVPRDTPPGQYTGTFTVTSDQG